MPNEFNWNTFNADDVDPNSYEALPPGTYEVMITGSEWKETKNGEGQYLELTLQVLDDGFSGRLIWDRLNLVNKNDKAVEIAQQTLSSICRAVNVPRPSDSSDLHDIPLMVKVKQGEYNGEITNEVKGYKAVSGTSTQTKQTTKVPVNKEQTQTAAATSGGSTKKPWE
jgi:hypothetical protein